MIEIERRFLCRVIDPQVLQGVSRWRISQGYLTAGTPSIRIRKREDEYILTAKSGRGLIRREVEFPVPSAEGAALFEMTGEHRLDKVRYQIGRWEIDLFEGKLAGLVLAEIELNDATEAIAPVPVGIELSREVTNEPAFTNQRLAALGDSAAARFVAQVRELE